MDISNFSVEDFVLDQEFRIWILYPNKNSNIHWERLIQENPDQVQKIRVARDILLNLSSKNYDLTDSERSAIWDSIDQELEDADFDQVECEIVPISSESILKNFAVGQKEFFWYAQWFRVAGILIVAFALSLIFNMIYKTEIPILAPSALAYEEYAAPPGVKSTLTMQDGSKVMLNSGSSIRYVKNFEVNQRVIFLEGEAYFEVAKDSLRPFSVTAYGVKTTALGTAFNISAYPEENILVSLVEGKVAVEVDDIQVDQLGLEMGEELNVNLEAGSIKKGQFDTELVLAWTNKKIIFRRVKIMEAIRVLENWYGVKFIFKNQPPADLLVYGEYEDEILENVLEGLSYTARFEYAILQDEVEITFK